MVLELFDSIQVVFSKNFLQDYNNCKWHQIISNAEGDGSHELSSGRDKVSDHGSH